MTDFTHLDRAGRASMVDIAEKAVTHRVATARAFVRMAPETLLAIRDGHIHKGEVLHVARLAGVMASKRTDELIPLCHTLGLEKIAVQFLLLPDDQMVAIEATASLHGKTGVEMEAMVAVQAAALTLYDMCKGRDRSMVLEHAHLYFKSGGRS
ncbi:MAG: cyclic pyranopterin monophosphate synthase MoaC, partial [Myxococcota bacterium]